MLTKVGTLLEALEVNGIRYCHWKSNYSLDDALSGQTDIDLLVHRQDGSQFRSILSQQSFQPAIVHSVESFPAVEHYFALDEERGVLVHVHAYYRVVTGESLTKNYRFPVEELLLHNTRREGAIPVPAKSAELIIFTLRMMLKHTTFTELVLLTRYWKQVPRELRWLLEDDPLGESLDLISCWLPTIDANLFSACVAALRTPDPLYRRVRLGLRLRSQLRPYARHSPLRAWLSGVKKFAVMLFRRLTGSKLGLLPQSGGAVIAFVGPEATGKSTLLSEVKHWFGEHFNVVQIHAGKPRSTFLTAVPNLLVPALRRLFPSRRSTRIVKQNSLGTESEEKKKSYSLFFALRSALLAYDRRALLSRAFSRAANGRIVLCDRYPSSGDGGPDGPQLSDLVESRSGGSVLRHLARLEAKFYREIPPPDLVIYLCAPLNVTLSRNRERDKTEPEDYVRWRHARSSSLTFDKTQVYRVSTDQPFDLTLLEVKKAIWKSLYQVAD